MLHLASSFRMLALSAALLTGCDAPERVAMAGAPGRIPIYVVLDRGQAAVHWNELARDLVATRGAATPFAIRGYAILSVAQYHAAIAAEGGPGGRPLAIAVAVAAASAEVLTYLFPDDAAALEEELAEFIESARKKRRPNVSIDKAVAVGRAAGAQMVERARGDRFFAPWSGTVPTGAGIWYSSTNPPSAPAGAGFGEARPLLLATTGQFRPAPHPAWGSPQFTAATAEVRQFADMRTPAQDSIAKFWHLPPGTYAPPGYWNEEATTLARKYHLDDRRAALVLALTNITMYDALLASHEAKYHYWLMRPSQADPGITLSVGLPNFPSYPSNHAAISGGAAVILGRAFPMERKRLLARAEEAALSRVLGGIHYRFDGDAGLALGRNVAAWTMAHSPNGQAPFNLQ